MIMVMNEAVIYTGLVLLGLCAGSFVGASIWRLRARQLKSDRAHKEPYDKAELSSLEKLTHRTPLKDRSVCLHCSYQLRWFDMIPLVSWLWLRGRCRHCHQPIGLLEPLVEAGLALSFVLTYAFWPVALTTPIDILTISLWLLAEVGLAMLFIYDLKWFILPDKVNYIVIAIGAVVAGLSLVGDDMVTGLTSIASALVILSGLYYVLYKVSSGRWVGFGDVKLGIGLALLLADWQLAFIALFAANLIGTMIVVPLMATGKLSRDSHVPLGPLLIVGTIFAQLVGNPIIDWYLGSLL